MKIVNLNNLNTHYEIKNLIIGHFNIIHNGHLKLINKHKNFSFLIFQNNPSKCYNMYSLDERIENLKQFKPDYIFYFDILEDNCDAVQFIEKYLKKIKIENIIVGSDYRFGKDKSGDVNLLKKYFNVELVNNDEVISTHKILSLIENGEIQKANSLSAFNFYYYGEVIHGKKIGTKNFFPTANIVQNKTIKIKAGSYVSKTLIDKKWYESISFVGIPKTVESNLEVVETYIFDFSENIYGKKIKVELLKFIRENQKFDSFDELLKNIKNDLQIAKDYFITK